MRDSPARRVQRGSLIGQLSLFEVVNTVEAIERDQALMVSTSADASVPERAEPPLPPASKPRAQQRQSSKRKMPVAASLPPDEKLLVTRRVAAEMLSLSIRSIDNLLANKQLPFKKIRGRTLIPVSALQRLARMEQSERLAS